MSLEWLSVHCEHSFPTLIPGISKRELQLAYMRGYAKGRAFKKPMRIKVDPTFLESPDLSLWARIRAGWMI
jgi:hypothetical protein